MRSGLGLFLSPERLLLGVDDGLPSQTGVIAVPLAYGVGGED